MRIGWMFMAALVPSIALAQTSGLPALKEELGVEITNRMGADQGLQSQINALAGKDSVMAEATARSSADAALQGQINQRATQAALDAEVAARQAADTAEATARANAVAAEASARAGADAAESAARTNAVAAEMSTRMNSDVTLQDQITQLQASIANMQGAQGESQRYYLELNCYGAGALGCVSGVASIPAGKVFVVEDLSGIYSFWGGTEDPHYFNVTVQDGSSGSWLATRSCKQLHVSVNNAAADCSAQVKFNLSGTIRIFTDVGTNGSHSLFAHLHGYLVNAAP